MEHVDGTVASSEHGTSSQANVLTVTFAYCFATQGRGGRAPLADRSHFLFMLHGLYTWSALIQAAAGSTFPVKCIRLFATDNRVGDDIFLLMQFTPCKLGREITEAGSQNNASEARYKIA